MILFAETEVCDIVIDFIDKIILFLTSFSHPLALLHFLFLHITSIYGLKERKENKLESVSLIN